MNNIINTIKKYNNIVILTHQRPDGDAIGTSIALYSYLKELSKNVDIIIEQVPEKFKFLTNINDVKIDSNKEYDLGIILDCSSKERIGQISDIFCNCKYTICIDHHATNKEYCNINYVEKDTSSCSQVLYYLFKKENISISKEMGEAFLLGLLTDTNGYSNNNVDSNTMNMSKELIELGVDHYNIFNKVMVRQSIEQTRLYNIARNNLEFYLDGKIAFTYITKKDMEETNTSYGDHEGIVDIGRNIEGVEVSLFIREDDEYRYSLRSNGKVDVSKIAENFNGGGHAMAAGGTFTSNFKETKEKIIDEIIKKVNEI